MLLLRSLQCTTTRFLSTNADVEFKQAQEKLNTLKTEPGNDVKLKIYALFKQV